MQLALLRHHFTLDEIVELGENYSKTEKYADIVLENLLNGLNFENYRSALFVGTTVGGLDKSEKEYGDHRHREISNTIETNVGDYSRHEAGEMAKFLAEKYNFTQNFCISAACSSGLHVIGLAAKAIEKGICDFAVAVGADALSGLTKNGFGSLMLIDPTGSAHPFDKNRAGIKLGEGAGGVVLCSQKFIDEINAKHSENINPEFFIVGYGSTCDAYHATAPDPSGYGAISAINKAIVEAKITPADIDWICSHGTGTLDNDLAEVNAYRAVFGDNIPPFMSYKGQIGHTLAASGAIETSMVMDCLKNEVIPASAGFVETDDNIKISPNTKKHSKKAKYVLKTSFGFGGNNSAIVIEKAE